MAEKNEYREINRAVVKKDAFAVMGYGRVYTDDLVPPDALCVKLLRSPYAMAEIIDIDTSMALKVPGVECVMTHKDVPEQRFSISGESYPGLNPFDRRILDRWVRFVGDPVAIIVADTERNAEKALKLVKVKYRVMDPVLSIEDAEKSKTVIHPEDNFVFQADIGGDLSRNVLSDKTETGPLDFDTEYEKCPVKYDETFRTVPNQQTPLETFRTFSYYDEFGRLTLVSSTQVTFHVRRNVAKALGLPEGMVRVIKPRIGGGFGAKQTLGTEVYAAAATWKTGKICYCRFTRAETSAYTNTRHEMKIRVRLGADRDGVVRALWVDTLGNAGAYAEHSVNVIGLSGHKTIPLYGHAKAWKFTARNVFTNTQPGAAFRGFGATQGCFAVETLVNRMAEDLGLDPAEVRLRNLPAVGETMSAYYNEPLGSCSLDRCIRRGREMIGWDEKYGFSPCSNRLPNGKYRGLGMAVTMQGSGISNVDNGSVILSLGYSGDYSLSVGASDMGTGCDTILAQMAAEVLGCATEDIKVNGVDTSSSPYDTGSYASATTYVTGNATVAAANTLIGKMYDGAAEILGCDAGELSFDGAAFYGKDCSITIQKLGLDASNGRCGVLSATEHFRGKTSPPPFVAAFAEVEVDPATGETEVTDLVGVVDCGTVINKALAKVQAEGGFGQAVGMALTEQSCVTPRGKLMQQGLMQYKIPSRLDMPNIRIEFEESFEPTGPFGAKSIGEVVMNSPVPAIASAIRNAVGCSVTKVPVTAESLWKAMNEK